jgi:hypothetical protein
MCMSIVHVLKLYSGKMEYDPLSKNLLLELLTIWKNKHNIANTIEYVDIVNPNGNPINKNVECRVKLTYPDQTVYEFVGVNKQIHVKKKEAEKDAAYDCILKLKQLESHVYQSDYSTVDMELENGFTSSKNNSSVVSKLGKISLFPLYVPVQSDYIIYILVDFDNKPQTDKIIMFTDKFINVCVISFAHYINPKKDLANITVGSCKDDAVDHIISGYTSRIIERLYSIEKTIIILSGDKFGSIHTDMAYRGEYPLTNIQHFSSQKDVIDYLSCLYHYEVDTNMNHYLIPNKQ